MVPGSDRLLTIDEWASFDGEPEVRYELIAGRLVALAPLKAWHGSIIAEVASICGRALQDRFPCRALVRIGVEVQREPAATVYVPDIVMTCEPADDNAVAIGAPRLVVEIVSPSSILIAPPTTGMSEQDLRLAKYMSLPTMEEIWTVSARLRMITIVTRCSDGAWPASKLVVGRGTFESGPLGRIIDLDEIYRFVPLPNPEPIELPDEPEPS